MSRSYETITFENGTSSLRDTASGQVMHSRIGPMEEARVIYVEQSRLKEKLLARTDTPLVLHDVGLGIAANALAALTLAESIAPALRRPLHLVSFENDPSALALALENPLRFSFLSGRKTSIDTLLRSGTWRSDDDRLRWTLLTGDYRLLHRTAPAPEITFFDFYAPQTCPELWGLQIFKNLFESTQTQRDRGGDTLLTTYSAATPVRIALLLAGFHVGYGSATGLKSETTVAATRLEDLDRPLGREWLVKLERSDAALPYGWGRERIPEVRARMIACDQFRI